MLPQGRAMQRKERAKKDEDKNLAKLLTNNKVKR
jgi:hypothetical protein